MESVLARLSPVTLTISSQVVKEDPGKDTENLGCGFRRKTGIFVVTQQSRGNITYSKMIVVIYVTCCWAIKQEFREATIGFVNMRAISDLR